MGDALHFFQTKFLKAMLILYIRNKYLGLMFPFIVLCSIVWLDNDNTIYIYKHIYLLYNVTECTGKLKIWILIEHLN